MKQEKFPIKIWNVPGGLGPREVSKVEQDTTEYVLTYKKFQLFSADATVFSKNLNFCFASENMNKNPIKSTIISPIFFQYCQPAKTSPNFKYFSQKSPIARLLYNDFGFMSHN